VTLKFILQYLTGCVYHNHSFISGTHVGT